MNYLEEYNGHESRMMIVKVSVEKKSADNDVIVKNNLIDFYIMTLSSFIEFMLF